MCVFLFQVGRGCLDSAAQHLMERFTLRMKLGDRDAPESDPILSGMGNLCLFPIVVFSNKCRYTDYFL